MKTEEPVLGFPEKQRGQHWSWSGTQRDCAVAAASHFTGGETEAGQPVPDHSAGDEPGWEVVPLIFSSCCLSLTHSDIFFIPNPQIVAPRGSGLWTWTVWIQILPLTLAV